MREHIIRERHELSAVSTCLHVTWSCQLLSSASKLLALEHPSRLQIPARAEKCMCSIQKFTPAWYITYVLTSRLISKSMPFPKSRVGRVWVSDGARSQGSSTALGVVRCNAVHMHLRLKSCPFSLARLARAWNLGWHSLRITTFLWL